MAIDNVARLLATSALNAGGGGGTGGDINVITVNGIPQTNVGGTVALLVPTKVSQVLNDAEYQTKKDVDTKLSNALVDYASKAEVGSLVAQVASLTTRVAALENLLSVAGYSVVLVKNDDATYSLMMVKNEEEGA